MLGISGRWTSPNPTLLTRCDDGGQAEDVVDKGKDYIFADIYFGYDHGAGNRTRGRGDWFGMDRDPGREIASSKIY